MSADEEQWYYNTSDATVSQGKQRSIFGRIGPFPDEATARRALEVVRERNRAADADERAGSADRSDDRSD